MIHEAVHKEIRKIFHHPENLTRQFLGSGARYRRDLLPVLFATLGFDVGAEIGVRFGEYSKRMCEANPNLKIYCIDPWMAYGDGKYTQERQGRIYEVAANTLKSFNAEIVRKTSMDALGDFKDGSLDFVYIDGDHSFKHAVMDIIFWAEKVKGGGIVAVHDYHHGRNVDVKYAVDAYILASGIYPCYVTKEAQPTAFWVKL